MADGQKSGQQSALSFDFVGDEALRAALAQDAHELDVASAGSAHKSTVVLAGSIIETILLDHLVSTDHKARTGNDPTKLEFRKLIEICNEEGVISDRTKQLLHAVRDYRNLIHPGRSLRLQDRVTPGSAIVARGIVEMVCAEMAERPNRRFGMTAEQVLTKVRQDPKIIGMVKHLLSELRTSELDRLVVKTLPTAFLEGAAEMDGPNDDVPAALAVLYEAAFSASTDAARRTRIDDLCQAIQNASGATVHVLLANTFWGWHLRYASPGKHRLIVDRLLIEHRGTELPFPGRTYEALLNVLSVEDAMHFLLEHRFRIRRWSKEDRTTLATALLWHPEYVDHFADDQAAAVAHHSKLVEEIQVLRAQIKPEEAASFATWLADVVDDIPF